MKRAATIATGILGLLACLNIFAGIHHLFTQTTTRVDLHLRWVDQQYILRGQNPYDACFAARSGDVEAYERKTGRNCRPFADLGAPQDVGYPPWSFVIGTLLYWPPWELLRLWCTAINLAALGYVAWWASRLAPNTRLAALFAVAVLACSGHVGTLRVGQGTIVVLAFLAAAHQADAAGRPLLSGLLMGLALLKPTVAGPFVLCLLITGRWRALCGCMLYVAGASCLVWWQTGVNPAEMTLQMFQASQRFLGDGTGPMNLALQLIPDPRQASAVLALVCIAGAAAILWRLRARPLLELYAIAAVCSRFWTYHRGYDDTVMIFLVGALAMLALETGRAAWTIAAIGAGITLWMPGAWYCDHCGPAMDAVNGMRMLVWLAAAIVLGSLSLGTPSPSLARFRDAELELGVPRSRRSVA
ncbi:MAG: glycosyltransferase family 87 protein [Tepidisphaerales bacterium]